jgi:hypothetical protein
MTTSDRLKAQREAKKRDSRASKLARKGRGFGLRLRQDRPVRPQRRRLLIVCEGAKTEPYYFEAFPVRGAVVDIDGMGDNTLSLVDRAIEAHARGGYDETWVVFDRDSFPAERFRAAVYRARAAGLDVAYTNEAFEAWYLMHFHYCDADLSRTTYRERLTRALGRRYEKNDRGIYAALLPMQPDAIRNAKALLASYGAAHDPERDNPSTTVHLLVERLNGLL